MQPFDPGRSHPITSQLRAPPRAIGTRLTIGTGAVICTLAVTASAEAAPYWFWSDHPAPSYEVIQPAPRRHLHKRPQRHDTKLEQQLEKPSVKPRGPLVIAISINQQSLKLYDANGLFAESPVSTGMRGHATPLGVFSVIQKHKYHRSNIYSGAPMPYMQRITWSGIALHAGVLPGYPASHGCIRMPMAFATKLWGWTRMGARVVVTAGEVTPASFSHPLLLAASTPLPDAPMASEAPQPVKAGKADKAAAAETPPDQPLTADAALRPGIALDESAPPKPAQIRTASARAETTTLTDAAPDSSSAAIVPAAAAGALPAEAPDAAPNPGAAAAPAKLGADSAAAIPATAGEAAAAGDPPKPVGAADDGNPAGAASKDQSRVSDEPPKPTLPAPKPNAQIAVFVSGKDGRLYVRQNQTPLFDVPVTIAPGERPLGTHVFTAEKDKDNLIRWTVMSMPTASARAPEPDKSRLRKNALAETVKAKPEPEEAAAALDRLTIPPEVTARIAMAMSSGASLIVSDQGIAAGETGEGTDFIIRLR